MNEKHTPAPWKIEPARYCGDGEIIPNDWKVMASDETDCLDATEVFRGGHLPDVNLIAAAPDMLEALEFVKKNIPVEMYYASHETMQKIDLAINKAKGIK